MIRSLSKHYHLRFDPKLSNVVCVICHITCACVACTPMLDKPWISGIPQKTRTISNFHQVYLLASTRIFQQLEHNTIITETNPFWRIWWNTTGFLGRLSDNMDSLVQYGKYGAINTTYTSTNGFYVIMFTSESYTLQINTKTGRNIITAG